MKTSLKKSYKHYEWPFVILFILLISGCTKEAKEPGDVLEVTTVQLQPDVYFHQAITDFANKNYKNSAEDIRKAIKVMDSISMKADEQHKKIIENSIAELSDLQSDVAFDKVNGIEDLNYCFARAGQALAGYHMDVYKTEYYNLEGKKAGEELKKAIAFIENSIAFNDHEFDAEEVALLNDLKQQAELLKEGKEISKDNIEALINRLNEHMTKWGNDIEVNYRKFQDSHKAVINDKI